VLALQEELARRDALQEQFGVEEELAEGARQAGDIGRYREI